ncbi:unnamed protein product [Dicrocoelium dendriticum]|nr:unnamed protein product [Dicrocoelium dendriticum]
MFLLILSTLDNYYSSLACMALALACLGFHSSGVLLNPQDLSPSHGGKLYGLMATIGTIPAFLGVYIAGYLLETALSVKTTVDCPWGRWSQSLSDVLVEVSVPVGTRAKDIEFQLTATTLSCSHRSAGSLLTGILFGRVKPDECCWHLEDQQKVSICLSKANSDPHNCLWPSLMLDHWYADEVTHDLMERQLTLERMQLENPGFDFSDAEISGNYLGGGPKTCSDRKSLLNRHFLHGGHLDIPKRVTTESSYPSFSPPVHTLSGSEVRSFYESVIGNPASSPDLDESTSSGSCPTCGSVLTLKHCWAQHLCSTSHQLAELLSKPKRPSALVIPPSNVGYQMLRRIGWSDPAFHEPKDAHCSHPPSYTDSPPPSQNTAVVPIRTGGLGPKGMGRRNPIATVLKRDRLGFGWPARKEVPRVTHFAAHDTKAIKLPFKRSSAAHRPHVQLDRQLPSKRLKLEKAQERRLRDQLNLSDEHYSILHGY